MSDKNREVERGAASITIELSDGTIEIIHGEAGVVLARKVRAEDGDWDKLWLFLTEILGAERTEAGMS